MWEVWDGAPDMDTAEETAEDSPDAEAEEAGDGSEGRSSEEQPASARISRRGRRGDTFRMGSPLGIGWGGWISFDGNFMIAEIAKAGKRTAGKL